MKTLATFALLLATTAFASDPVDCPLHAQHMAEAAAAVKADGSAAHGAGVDSRHDKLVMSRASTAHSFRLFADGGAIELRANDAADTATIDAVRTHLKTVAEQFAKNDFSTPTFVHDRAPAGVTGMKNRHDAIAFHFEPLPTGGRIHIVTSDPEALAAVHDFLKFQVVEHRTKDSGEVEADR